MQSVDAFGRLPPKTAEDIFRTKLVNNYSLRNFIEMLRADIFRPNNYQRIRNNLLA